MAHSEHDLLTPTEAAARLRMSVRTLLAHSGGRRPKIPAFKLNGREFRYHLPTVIASLAADAGVSPEVIALALSSPPARTYSVTVVVPTGAALAEMPALLPGLNSTQQYVCP